MLSGCITICAMMCVYHVYNQERTKETDKRVSWSLWGEVLELFPGVSETPLEISQPEEMRYQPPETQGPSGGLCSVPSPSARVSWKWICCPGWVERQETQPQHHSLGAEGRWGAHAPLLSPGGSRHGGKGAPPALAQQTCPKAWGVSREVPAQPHVWDAGTHHWHLGHLEQLRPEQPGAGRAEKCVKGL